MLQNKENKKMDNHLSEKPLYKKPWFWIFVVVFIFGVSQIGRTDSTTSTNNWETKTSKKLVISSSSSKTSNSSVTKATSESNTTTTNSNAQKAKESGLIQTSIVNNQNTFQYTTYVNDKVNLNANHQTQANKNISVCPASNSHNNCTVVNPNYINNKKQKNMPIKKSIPEVVYKVSHSNE
ncbi:hypothetical protein LB941_02060 [Ligilactobacillus sp. WILCCON 0076]|uniref:Uncharacterized protein n=1 Tax=Ligilactobacillus ubinensis TaxID=2876789 RepID=A0A9X2FKD5_9LACO|nr:hypothetical protein [Ligilactobacillus ubinensis]MCP0886118.1 hypothetical protein [Ligilactobacillus ubinensis]